MNAAAVVAAVVLLFVLAVLGCAPLDRQWSGLDAPRDLPPAYIGRRMTPERVAAMDARAAFRRENRL